ncbi:MAG TPA: hypothetical protein VGE98_13635 [Thermoanaerobaculia bacterium]
MSARRLSPLVLCAMLATACGGSGAPTREAAGPTGPTPRRGGGWVGEVAVEWLRFRAPREWVVIGSGGVAVGPVGHPLALTLLTRPEWASDARAFRRTYAPFHLRTPEGDLAFLGLGGRAASPAEQRMIAGWARRVAAEAVLGRNDSYGLALAWHRSGTGGVACDELDLYASGEVWARSCQWQRPAVRGRLDDAQAARFYVWFDGLAPFQASDEEAARPDAPPARLTFAGQGRRPAAPADTTAIATFAAALFRDLAANAGHPASAAEAAPLAVPDDLAPPQRTAPPTAPRPEATTAEPEPSPPPPG